MVTPMKSSHGVFGHELSVFPIDIDIQHGPEIQADIKQTVIYIRSAEK